MSEAATQPEEGHSYASRRVNSSQGSNDAFSDFLYASGRSSRNATLRRRLQQSASLDERLGIPATVPYDAGARDARGIATPDGTKSRSPSRRTKTWSVVLFILQALAALPSFIGACQAVYRSIRTFKSPPHVLLNSRQTLHPDAIDWLIAAIWALACSYFSHALARGLMRRWLVYYTVLPTVIRSISLQAICWPLAHATYRIITPQRPILMWYICATTAAVSNIIQTWLTSNISDRVPDAEERKQNDLSSRLIRFVFGPSVRGTKFRKGTRTVSWRRVMWRTVLPFCLLGWSTSALFLLQQRLTANHIKRDSQAIERSLLLADLVNVDANAPVSDKIQITLLVISSWTAKSQANREMFRSSTLQFLPDLDPSIHLDYRFVLGFRPSTGANLVDEVSLMQESKRWKDIQIVKAADGYDDLSRKMMASWRWAANQSADYVLKTDDDIFLRLDTITSELAQLGRQREYWRGFAYWDIPAIRDSTNKNADHTFDLDVFPPFTAGALHILSSDLVQQVARISPPGLYVQNEDQNLGIWLYASGIRPIHDYRIQQGQVCEDSMIAKHFSSHYIEKEGMNAARMYLNVKEGKPMCQGFLQKWCGVCYPSCRGRSNHWRDWGFECHQTKGSTLLNRPGRAVAASPNEPVKIPPTYSATELEQLSLLARSWLALSDTADWHLLHLLCWTTGVETFQERHYEAIETIWAHEPRAKIVMLSTTLPDDFLTTYTRHGYDIEVVEINPEFLLREQWYVGPQSKLWLEQWERWSQGPNFFSHLTDFLRYGFLWRFGGTYLDMDAPWVRSPPDSELEFIGADQSTVASDAEWTLDETGRYLAPGVMRFKRGWRVFRDILEDAFSVHYSAECFNCVGPRAITKGVKKDLYELERSGFTIVDQKRLYPRGWQTSRELVVPLPPGDAKRTLAEMVETSWSIHLFGKMTNHLSIERDSVIREAFDAFNLRIARRRGPPDSRTLEPVSGTDEGVYGLASGVELVAPSTYTYKRSPPPAFVKVQDRLPSLDGSFDGLDLIRIRNVRSPFVEHASVHVSVRHGAVGWGTSTTVRDRYRYDQHRRGAERASENDIAASQSTHLEFGNGTTMRDVNVALASLRYVPSRAASIAEQDEMKIRVVYGDEGVVERTIRIGSADVDAYASSIAASGRL